MKIVFLVSSLRAGGAERVATTLCNAWAARGDEVTLVQTFSGGGESFYPLAAAVVHVELAQMAGSTRKGVLSYWRRFRALRAVLIERRPDVVISFLPHVSVVAILASMGLPHPVVICERNDPGARAPSAFWERASRLSFRYAHMMTVQTEAVASRIHSYYPKLRAVRVVPNPLPDEIAGWSRTVPIAARKVLLSIGRLDPQKQVDQTIDAFAALAAVHADWDLHIYGEGALLPLLQQQVARLGLEKRVLFKGRTAQAWHVMAAADAFVMSSAHEGFPNALLEAMGLGLPCVVTDCPSGPREITRGGSDALLVPAGSRHALVAALRRLMEDAQLRAQLGARARASVVERYRLARVLEIWDDIFDELRHPSGAGLHAPLRRGA